LPSIATSQNNGWLTLYFPSIRFPIFVGALQSCGAASSQASLPSRLLSL
jgi:hypothetical protein